mgnify:FL=1
METDKEDKEFSWETTLAEAFKNDRRLSLRHRYQTDKEFNEKAVINLKKANLPLSYSEFFQKLDVILDETAEEMERKDTDGN